MLIPLRVLAVLFATLLTSTTLVGQGGEVLYNGITLPDSWPPNTARTQIPSTPFYLVNPPSVIPIDIGRQLFVDDFTIEQTDLTRSFHKPVPYEGNPILEPGDWPDNGTTAQPFSDGVWYDPLGGFFKMWYDGGFESVSYAISTDGMNWTRPSLPEAGDTNRVINMGFRDSGTVWIDSEDHPSRRYKAFVYGGSGNFKTFFSADGVQWEQQALLIRSFWDRSTMFWNPFRRTWVKSVRAFSTLPPGVERPGYQSRFREYAESPDLVNWIPGAEDRVFWTGPDENDPPYTEGLGVYPQLYNLDAVAYESLLVGLFSWYYPAPDADIVELSVGFSRDGFHWDRPKRGHAEDAFIAASNEEGTWNRGNTQSSGGGFLVVGNELWFYFSGRETLHSIPSQHRSTGLAKMRRDGFASMDAGATEGTLTTRPVQFNGDRLFVNIDNPGGELRAEVLDLQSNVIAPLSKANSVPVSANRTIQEILWEGNINLSAVAGQPVKIRFYLTNGKLYSFWVSDNGASNGYVAAGGPGFEGPQDTLAPTEDINAPLVSITTPGLENPVSGTIQLTASAGDDVGAVGVRYQVGGQNIGSEVSNFPFAVDFDTSSFTDGTYTLNAIARDAAGNVGYSTALEIDIRNDAEPPTVEISFPSTGAVVSETISLEAAASDNIEVVGVQFKVNGNDFGVEDQTLPYETSLDTRTLSNGIHAVTATARDAAGNVGNAVIVEFEVANETEAPSIEIVSPAEGAAVSGTISLEATASDNVGVVGVQFKVDGNDFGAEVETPPYQIALDTTSLSNGPHTATAAARDAAGNVGNAVIVEFEVANETEAPNIEIVSPAEGAVVSGTISLEATASDNVGVEGVQFKIDGGDLGVEVLSPPYQISLDTISLSNGPHTVTATARDAVGNVGNAAAVEFEVANDLTSPSVSISSPGHGEEVSGTITVQATASDNVGVVGVRFKVDGANVGAEDQASPYAASLDTTLLSDGSHTVTATARDAAENTATASITVDVDNAVVLPVLPEMTHPAPGSTLPGSTVTFQWVPNQQTSAKSWTIYLGSSLGARDIHDSRSLGVQFSFTSNRVPTDGRTIYVRLWYQTATGWKYVDYTYTAHSPSVVTPPALTIPVPGSVLPGSSATFSWEANDTPVSDWQLLLGSSAGASDIQDSGSLGANLSFTSDVLPTDGRTVFVRLRYHTEGQWQFAAYTYTAATVSPPALTSPAPGSVLPGSSATFSWSANDTTVSEWQLLLGSSSGASDIQDSGSLGAIFSFTSDVLPTDGRTVFARLRYHAEGEWQFVDGIYTAATVILSPPALTSPAPGSVLPGSSATFSWSANDTPVSEWQLLLGSSLGASDIQDSGSLGANLSFTSDVLPTDGRTVFVRLLFRTEGNWQFADHTYTAVTIIPPALTSPAPGSVLPGSSVTFSWQANNTPVSEWQILLGSSLGANDIQDSGSLGVNLSFASDVLPTDSRTVFVRLRYNTEGEWQFVDATYTAAPDVVPELPQMTQPIPGSTLPGSTVTFQWVPNQQTSAKSWTIYLGSSLGARDIHDSRSLGVQFSFTSNRVPTDGRTIFVRLWYQTVSGWRFVDYTYTALSE